MTTGTKVDLQREYTEEEQDAMFDAYIDAIDKGDEEEMDRILEQMPINPRWAKIIRDVMGTEYLQKHFNITRANKVFGEGWANG